MAVFFRPSDITTRICTVSNKTKGGSAFAVCENGEQVFVSPKIVEATDVEVGDMLQAYCIDNHREADTADRFAVRWRAIRVIIQERFQPPVPVAPAPVDDKPTGEDLGDRIHALLAGGAILNSTKIGEALGVPGQTAHSWLWWQHKKGRIASVRLYSERDQSKASHVYFAKDTDAIRKLLG